MTGSSVGRWPTVPAGDKLAYTRLTAPFFLYMKVAFFAGLFLAAPVILLQVWLFIAPGLYKKERRLAARLVGTVIAEGPGLDRRITDVTSNWRLERIGAIERSVLRLAAAELHRGETPPRVVLKEAVRLAERYGSLTSARFVNGVLDALAREMGRL